MRPQERRKEKRKKTYLRHILYIVLQVRVRPLQRSHERLSHSLRASGTRVRVVIGEERVRRARAQALEHVGAGLAVVDEDRPHGLGGLLVVGDEAVAAVSEGAGFPGVVGRSGGDDDGCALGLEELGGVDEVGVEGLHGL